MAALASTIPPRVLSLDLPLYLALLVRTIIINLLRMDVDH